MTAVLIELVNVPAARLTLGDAVQRIGRAKDCQLCVPAQYASVSRRHAEVWQDARFECWIRDCNSTCGIRINRVPLPRGEKARIQPGDEITLGDLQLRVIDASQEVIEVPDSYTASSTLPIVNSSSDPDETGPLASLTPAEREIVLWMTRGYTSPEELSQKLKRSPHTIRTHHASIFTKLGVHSRDALLAYLRRNVPPG